MKRFLVIVARPLEFLLGLAFILAAVLKAQDANLFVSQIHGYGVIQNPSFLGPIALTTLALESFLGTAMILGLRLRFAVLMLVELMLVFFTVLIAYAWVVYGLEDCGCFGPVKFPPEAAIAKNIVMFLAAALAWRGFVLQAHVPQPGRAWRAALSMIAAVVVLGWSAPQLYQSKDTAVPLPPVTKNGDTPGASETVAPPKPAQDPAPFAEFVLETETGERYELGKGEYLVALLSMTCEHCMGSVPFLNELMYAPDMPPLVGVVYEPEAGDTDDFKAKTNPQFPFYSLGNNFLKFSALIGAAPPRLSYIRDGRLVKFWDAVEPDYVFPLAEEIVAAIQEARAAGAQKE